MLWVSKVQKWSSLVFCVKKIGKRQICEKSCDYSDLSDLCVFVTALRKQLLRLVHRKIWFDATEGNLKKLAWTIFTYTAGRTGHSKSDRINVHVVTRNNGEYQSALYDPEIPKWPFNGTPPRKKSLQWRALLCKLHHKPHWSNFCLLGLDQSAKREFFNPWVLRSTWVGFAVPGHDINNEFCQIHCEGGPKGARPKTFEWRKKWVA